MKRNRMLWSLLGAVAIISMLTACGGTSQPQPQPTAVKEAPPAPEAPKATEAPKPAEAAPEAKVQPGSIYNRDEYEKVTGTVIEKYGEAPMLAEQVAAGTLPPVEERLPENPVVLVPWNAIGKYGGTVRHDEFTVGYDTYNRHLTNSRMLFFDASEVTYYQAGLSAPDVKPWILESWSQNAEATEFTFTIRKGLRWSDGVELTTEDLRFHVDDTLLNPELSPVPPQWLRWNPGKVDVTTKVEIVDPYTFKINFAMPYGAFVRGTMRDSSWGAWTNFFAPAHFLKQFHTKYTDIQEILPKMVERGYRTAEEWPNFFNAVDTTSNTLGDSGLYYAHPYATEVPVLYPWVVTEVYPDGSGLMARNPYFFAIDPAGNQLPYIDNQKRQFISSHELLNLDILAGKTDVQAMYIKIDDFTLYKQNEEQGNYRAIPVRAWQHHVLMYWFNPSVNDPKVSAALSQPDFLKALSIALDRDHINEAVFKGLGTPAQFAPPKGSPLYNEELTNYAAEYDPEGAKKLLDDLGYKDVNGDGFREAPDGSEFTLQLTYYQVTPATDAGVAMASTFWEPIGIRMDFREVLDSAFYNFMNSNEVQGSIWWANGPDFGDGSFVGMRASRPLWWQWFSTQGEKGIEPPDWAKRIMEIQDERQQAPTMDDLLALDAEGWDLLVKNLVIIGTVEGPKNPLILNKDLRNVEYGFDQNWVGPTYLEAGIQWYYENPEAH